MITSASNTMTLSWLISCGLSTTSRSHEREPFFDQYSASLCQAVLEARGSWFSLRGHFFPRRWQTEIAKSGGAFVLRWGRGDFDQASLWWHFTSKFRVVTIFFLFSLFFYFFVSFVKKWRLCPGRSTPSPTRGQRSSFAERTMKFPILIFQVQLVLVPSVPQVTVFRGRCTRQLLL